MGHRERTQAKYDALKAAAAHAHEHDQDKKDKLAEKMTGKSPGKLSKRELELAARSGSGEGVVIKRGLLKRLLGR